MGGFGEHLCVYDKRKTLVLNLSTFLCIVVHPNCAFSQDPLSRGRYMKQVLIAALVALFALSFSMAQDQTARTEKSTTTTTTSTTEKKAGCCAQAQATCCADAKGCAHMKDCPMMKGSATGAKTSKQGTTSATEVTKTGETKPAEAK
jgi:hypothetical protein